MAQSISLSFVLCVWLATTVTASPLLNALSNLKIGDVRKLNNIDTPRPIHHHFSSLVKKLQDVKKEQLSVSQPLLTGTFMTSCEQFDCLVIDQPGNTIPCSAIAVERTESDKLVLTDLTIYVNDYNCRPNNTETLAKLEIKSQLNYHGPSRTNPGATKIEYATIGGNYTFNFQGDKGVIPLLNKECPCNGTWSSGVQRQIVASDCKATVNQSSEVYDLCNYVVGSHVFMSYRFDSSQIKYYQSEGAFNEREGYAQQIQEKYVNVRLPETGVVDPNDCEYDILPKCDPAIEIASNACRGCVGLECEGCIYREYPVSLNQREEYSRCCPCLYYYAERHPGNDFLKINC